MRVALSQINTEASKHDNLKKIESTIKTLPLDVDLVVFPEYSMGVETNGVDSNYVRKNAERLEGDFVGTIADVSASSNVSVILPIHEVDDGKFYDSAVILERGKIRGRYRKINLFSALGYREDETYTRGSHAVTFELDGWRFGLIICYDLRFPEISRLLALNGSEALLVPSAWYRGASKEETWISLLRARAIENTEYVIGVGNCAAPFIGRSCVIGTDGIINADLGVGEKTLMTELNKTELDGTRRSLPVLEQAKDQTYKIEKL